MNGRQVSYVVFFIAVAITVVAGQSGYVSFSDNTVTMTCPGEKDVKWSKEKDLRIEGSSASIDEYTEKHSGLYSCSYKQENEEDKEKTYYFFIKAKVCKGCVELDMVMGFVVVFADVMLTLVIVGLVYFCARKKAGTAAPQRAAQARTGRGQARGPPVPDPDYQALNPATRSNEVYAQPNARR